MIKFIQYGILFVLAASPWAFGSVEPWAYSIINLSALLFLIFWCIHKFFLEDHSDFGGSGRLNRPNRLNRLNRPFVFYPLLAFIALVLFQLLPLPVSIVKVLSPARISYIQKLNLGFLGTALPSRLTLSIDPYLTSLALTNLVCLLILFFLIIQLLHSPSERIRQEGGGPSAEGSNRSAKKPMDLRRNDQTDQIDEAANHTKRPNRRDGFLNQLVFTIITIGFLVALFGIIQKLSGATEIYWIRQLTHGGTLMGPFVNRDHFAGFLEMPLGLVLGLFVFMRREAPYRWLLSLAAVVMGAAIFYSGSRGGVLCFFFELLSAGILGFAFRQNRRNRPNERNRPVASLLLIPALLILVILAISYIGPDAILGRLNEDILKDERLPVWHDTLGMGKAFPVTGCGFGTFRSAFNGFQTKDYTSQYLQPHNDYLQLLSEMGILGGGLALIVLIMIGYPLYCERRSLSGTVEWPENGQILLSQRSAHHHFRRTVRFGVMIGMYAILLHSFFDFNLQIPSTAVLFAIEGAIGWS